MILPNSGSEFNMYTTSKHLILLPRDYRNLYEIELFSRD